MRHAMRVMTALCALVLTALVTAPAPADARRGEPGPRLSVPRAKLRAGLNCHESLRGAPRNPVLLVHATTVNSEENWGWTYARALPAAGYRHCTVDLPARSMEDIQVATEYVIFAVRRMHAQSHRRVAVIGQSQGGLEPRWALRFWPDLRLKVADYISFGTPQHGTAVVDEVICRSSCAPALWQMRTDSRFMEALNRGGETFGRRVAYTSIFTRTDQFVQPQPEASSIEGAANIAVQDVCPGHVQDHVNLAFDPVVYALALDALERPGPASVERIDRSVCTEDVMPGVNRAELPRHLAAAYQSITTELTLHPRTEREPPLKCYARRNCGDE